MIEIRAGKNNPLLYKFQDGEYKSDKSFLKNFVVSVCDLYVFDEEENLVLASKTLTHCNIDVDESGGIIKFTDATFDLSLSKFIAKNNKEEKTSWGRGAKQTPIIGSNETQKKKVQ